MNKHRDSGATTLFVRPLLTTPNAPEWAVVIPAYGRLERFFICLCCLCAAITDSKLAVQILVMDNAPASRLENSLERYLTSSHWQINVTYVHYPLVNQSVLRNTALTLLHHSVQYVMFCDSDIYMSRKTFGLCHDFLEQEPSVMAIAPPLAPYMGGKHNAASQRVKMAIENTGTGLIMPSKYDYSATERHHKNFLQALMLRGVFALRRSCLQETFGKQPWLPAFQVWQNVPFFLTLRELGKLFGYLLEPDAVCLHDERPHSDTISLSMSDWHAQTVKSFVLLFHRNQLWRPEQQSRNARFLNAVTPVLQQHLSTPITEVLPNLFTTAQCLSLGRTKGRAMLRVVRKQLQDKTAKHAVSLLLAHGWTELQTVQSRNLAQPM